MGGLSDLCVALSMRLPEVPRKRGRRGPSQLTDRFHAVRALARPLGSGDVDISSKARPELARRVVAVAPNFTSARHPNLSQEAPVCPTPSVSALNSACDAAIPAAQTGRITMAVGLAEDANGVRSVLIGTSEPGGYLRPGVTFALGETIAAGTGHAEVDIIAHAQANGLRLWRWAQPGRSARRAPRSSDKPAPRR